MAQYRPKDVTAKAAAYTLSGFAEDSFVKVEPLTKEAFMSHVGAQGETGWTENHDGRAKITIVLMQNSPSNVHLQTLLTLKTPFPFVLQNSSDGQYIGAGVDARVVERPDAEFGKEFKDRTWVIIVNDWNGAFVT